MPTVFNWSCDLPKLNLRCLIKIGLRKWNFFLVKVFFSWILISKMGVKMIFRTRTRNHAADSKIRSAKNRSLSRWDSRVPPDSLRVNLLFWGISIFVNSWFNFGQCGSGKKLQLWLVPVWVFVFRNKKLMACAKVIFMTFLYKFDKDNPIFSPSDRQTITF